MELFERDDHLVVHNLGGSLLSQVGKGALREGLQVSGFEAS